ncbi:MAG TPA: hypothetical protein VHR45_08785 [Thermoanaerobaculia bacterium]|nr:hypothetical protein [Thermoanaerobaculia bacterium]
MKAAELDLIGPAAAAAALLEADFPDVVFTSGRRDTAAQAHAMATNVLKAGRDWIAQTYRPSEPASACQAWVDSHPEADNIDDLAAGLLTVLDGFGDDQLRRLSKHLSGEAFDVAPVPGARGEAIQERIGTLPGLEKFLNHEGGLTRWHAQFRDDAANG